MDYWKISRIDKKYFNTVIPSRFWQNHMTATEFVCTFQISGVQPIWLLSLIPQHHESGIFVWYHRNFIFLEFLFTFSKIYGPNINYVLPPKNANYLYHSLNSRNLNVSYSAARKKAVCYAKSQCCLSFRWTGVKWQIILNYQHFFGNAQYLRNITVTKTQT